MYWYLHDFLESYFHDNAVPRVLFDGDHKVLPAGGKSHLTRDGRGIIQRTTLGNTVMMYGTNIEPPFALSTQ